MSLHEGMTYLTGAGHQIHKFEFTDASARALGTGYTLKPTDVKKIAIQLDDFSSWILTNHSPITWVPVGKGGATTPADSIVNTPAGGLTSTNVQAALNELDTEAQTQQTAVQDALNLKAPLASPTFTGTVSGITAAMVGLGSVSNVAVGVPNGVCGLDSGAKIATINIPDSVLGQVEYMGTWAALTNTPTLPAAATANKGYYYICSNSGTQFSIPFVTGDWVISDGTAWTKVDNTDAVASVFGRNGAILANAGDYTAAQVTNTPAGGIAAITVQAALNELDSEKANLSGANFTGAVNSQGPINLGPAGQAYYSLQVEGATLSGVSSIKAYNGTSLNLTTFNGVSYNSGITVTTAGNVGVGTAAPEAKLHVSSGNSSFALFGPNALFGGKLAVGAGADLHAINLAQVLCTNGNLHLDAGTYASVYVGAYSLGNTFINPSGGSVGIGTTDPTLGNTWGSPSLCVAGVRGALVARTTSTNGIATIRLAGPTTGSDFHINLNDASGDLTFHPQAIGTPAFVISKNGNIGMGVTVPSAKLEVVGGLSVENGTTAGTHGGIYLGPINNDGGMVCFRAGDYSSRFFIQNNDTNTGVERLSFYAGPIGNSANVETFTLSGNSLVGIRNAVPTHMLHLGGGAFCDGTGDWIAGSDRAFKKDIAPMTNRGLAEVLALTPMTYVHKEDTKNTVQIGFIAQDVKPIIPEVVDGEEGSMGLSYGSQCYQRTADPDRRSSFTDRSSSRSYYSFRIQIGDLYGIP
jgi:hypothetical protein